MASTFSFMLALNLWKVHHNSSTLDAFDVPVSDIAFFKVSNSYESFKWRIPATPHKACIPFFAVVVSQKFLLVSHAGYINGCTTKLGHNIEKTSQALCLPIVNRSKEPLGQLDEACSHLLACTYPWNLGMQSAKQRLPTPSNQDTVPTEWVALQWCLIRQ